MKCPGIYAFGTLTALLIVPQQVGAAPRTPGSCASGYNTCLEACGPNPNFSTNFNWGGYDAYFSCTQACQSNVQQCQTSSLPPPPPPPPPCPGGYYSNGHCIITAPAKTTCSGPGCNTAPGNIRGALQAPSGGTKGLPTTTTAPSALNSPGLLGGSGAGSAATSGSKAKLPTSGTSTQAK
jgi:hypothetical protein